jgi:hypothetical protein
LPEEELWTAITDGELLAAIRCYFEAKAELIELKAVWTP